MYVKRKKQRENLLDVFRAVNEWIVHSKDQEIDYEENVKLVHECARDLGLI